MEAQQPAVLWTVMSGEMAPSVRWIAESLSRIPRWLNRTSRPWSVLQHVLAADEASLGEKPDVRLAVLLHDVEEAITGDIPKPCKTPEQIRLGDEIRRMVYRTLSVPYPNVTTLERVDEIDQQIALAEASVLGHPRLRVQLRHEPDLDQCDLVWRMLDLTPRAAIDLYVDRVNALLKDPVVRALIGRG